MCCVFTRVRELFVCVCACAFSIHVVYRSFCTHLFCLESVSTVTEVVSRCGRVFYTVVDFWPVAGFSHDLPFFIP